jgi:thymidylate synthase
LTTWQRKEAAIVMHLSAPHIDRLKPIGSPCLQFVEVLWDANDTINLVALYRNHDFLKKALGNFIGLARLLAFIAKEANKTPGKLVCHSVRAYCDSAPKLRNLISR